MNYCCARCAATRACFCYPFFFFQAEDGIRDVAVTGVQTCALPISGRMGSASKKWQGLHRQVRRVPASLYLDLDRKSTRLNSSHGYISYAVFCLKKKKKKKTI